MSKIQILPDNVANQIAAGEVVERPVSVIKELLENSIDAGANKIEVEFRNGGKNYMHVEDNGCGMSPEDARLSLQRHATSKIKLAKDLNTIASFGFRGEALPSIASVSRFTLKTRTEDASEGLEISINGGKLVHEKACGMNPGTRIEVANLFNTVPARRKFLKTENTEAAHITHLIRLYAIANPKVGFVLKENGKVLFQSPPSSKLIERVGRLWNKNLVNDLVEVNAAEVDLKLSGLISKPGIARSTRQEMVTFVNGRPVDSKTLSYAVIEGYHTFIPKGRYPIVFLFLEVDPSLVDVNVHPAKREVRFRQEQRLRQFVLETISKAFNGHNEKLVKDFRGQFTTEVIWEAPKVKEEKAMPESKPAPPKPVVLLPTPSFEQKNQIPKVEIKPQISRSVPAPKPTAVIHSAQKSEVRSKSDWRFMGHLKEGYAIFETPKGMVVLNCKGARQRIRYESVKKDLEARSAVSQTLLLPLSLELEPLVASVLEENLKTIEKVGFLIERFGRGFYRVTSIPRWLEPEKAEAFLMDTLDVFKEQGGKIKTTDLLHERIAQLVVKQTSGMGRCLHSSQAEQFVEELMRCQKPQTCPRGYPTFYEMPSSELDKRFGQ